MKNILILANGNMAKHFVQWVGKRHIDKNHYYITCIEDNVTCTAFKSSNHINFIDIDPTSYIRLKNLIEGEELNFSTIFIVMDSKEESLYTLKNIRMLVPSTLVVFVSKWDDLVLDDENVNLLNMHEIMAGNLYEKLPNIPIIAKNIGLGRGEIMELLIPFGSSFAYRHVGAISHRKWRIVAIYRKEKQLFPNNATMILPNDRLIVIGNPMVLEDLYQRVNKRQGLFPEPFGKNLYLIVDMQEDRKEILSQIDEAIFLSNKLSKTKLFIRFLHISNRASLEEFRLFESPDIRLLMSYDDNHIFRDIDYDISQLDVGLFLLTKEQFFKKHFKKYFYELMKPIYLFGEKSLINIKDAVILMGEEIEMESLSASVFDFSETLNIELSLCDYDPEGDFDNSKNVVEHYKSLSQLYSFKINFEKKRVNPIRELLNHEEILHIAPFHKNDKNSSFIRYLSTHFKDYFLTIKKHPQLLIPVDN